MKKLILGVLMLVALASCDESISEGDKINSIRRYNDSSGYEMITNHGRSIQSSSNHKVGDIVTIVPATDHTQFKLPMRDAETRQCLNCDTVVITNTVCIDCDGPLGTSDTTIHYYKSKYP